ncbi:MAG: DUF2029 domain-containing protein [Beijerinckiaceae bacterium]|nr:DUF2029 domain-containing protein [Beijerinckiaceae bacterium]
MKQIDDNQTTHQALVFGLALSILTLLLIVYRSTELASTHGVASVPLVDFNAFYLSGQLALDGRINDAYRFASLLEAQRQYAGRIDFMPWTYPPPFNLVVGALASLSIQAAYLVFVGGSFTAYAAVLRAVRPQEFFHLILLGFTSAIVTIICGQNGFLTASLIGLFCLLYLKSSRWSGVVLGLMIIKPHLALGLGVWLLARREFSLLLVSAITALFLSAVATVLLGPSVWSAFFGAVAEAGGLLKQGDYPLFRMTSVYAGVRSAGAPHSLAFAAHIIIAFAAIIIIAQAALRRSDARVGLGVAVLGSLFISPYSYDYDLPMLAIAFALLWPEMNERDRKAPLYTLLVMAWLAGASGFVSKFIYWSTGEGPQEISVGWLFMLALGLYSLRRLQRPVEAGANIKPA